MSFERHKIRIGRVVRDKMDKTVVVAVEWRRPTRLYRKAVKRRERFKAHDADNQCRIGDLVRIRETRPLSKTKRWRIIEIMSRGDVAEIQPEEVVGEEAELLAPATQSATVSTAEDEIASGVSSIAKSGETDIVAAEDSMEDEGLEPLAKENRNATAVEELENATSLDDESMVEAQSKEVMVVSEQGAMAEEEKEGGPDGSIENGDNKAEKEQQ